MPVHCPPPIPRDLVAAFLAGHGPATARAYAADLEDFRAFCGAPTAQQAAADLLALPLGEANRAALAYQASLAGRGLAAATINRRLLANLAAASRPKT